MKREARIFGLIRIDGSRIGIGGYLAIVIVKDMFGDRSGSHPLKRSQKALQFNTLMPLIWEPNFNLVPPTPKIPLSFTVSIL